MSPDSEMGDFPTSKSSNTAIRRILDSTTCSSTRSTQNHGEKHDQGEENGGHRNKRPRPSGEEVATPAVVGAGNGRASILPQSCQAPIPTLGTTRALQSAISHNIESGHNGNSEHGQMYQTISPTQGEGLAPSMPPPAAVPRQPYTGELLQHAGTPSVARDAPTPSLQQASSTEGTQVHPTVSFPPLATTASHQHLIQQQSASVPANSTITFLPQHQQPQPTPMLNYAAFPPFQLQSAGVPSLPMPPLNALNHQTTSPAHLLAIAAAAGAAGIPQQATNVYASHHQPTALLPPPQVQQPVPSPHHLVALTGMGHTGGRRGALLYIPNDNEVLSESQIFLRKQIEFFETALEDVGKTTSGRRRPIMLNQVGIQCRHCGVIPTRYRQKAAVYYPAKMASIYQAAQNMALTHLTTQCQHIDEDTRKRLKEYQEGRSVAGHGGKKYWADTAKSQGVIECEDGGLRFAGTVPPVQQPATIMATIPTTPAAAAAAWSQAPPPSAA